MTALANRPKLPEDWLPDLAPVYEALGEDYEAMDVLDAVVFARPKSITRAQIAAHCCGDLTAHRAATEIAARMRRLQVVLRKHGLRLRSYRVSGRGTFNRRYSYRLVEMCLAGVVAIAVAMPIEAVAQPNCRPRDEIVKMLAEKYDEHRRAYGISNPLQMLELFVSSAGTWTALMSRPSGVSCMVASGQDWTELALPEPGEPM